MATDRKAPAPWRVSDDVRALVPHEPSVAEAKILAALDEARADVERLHAGSAALANRRAAAEREAEDLRGLAGIGQATDGDVATAEAAAAERVATEQAHAEAAAAAEARAEELEEAADRARRDTASAFAEAMGIARRNATQDLVNAIVEASRCTSVLYGVMQHGAFYGQPMSTHLLFDDLRADMYTLRGWLSDRRKEGFDVPDLPMNANRFAMLEPSGDA